MRETSQAPADTAQHQQHDHGGHGHDHGAAELDHSQGVPSTAAIAGHPLHAMLIPFPIAFLLGALAADLAAWGTGDAFWTRAALWLAGAGV